MCLSSRCPLSGTQAMIVKKLLNHVEVQLSSQGLDGTEELNRVEIPGLANTFDPRCGTRSVRRNCKAYLVALKLESRSIMQWLKAFNLCRAHHCASFSSGGGKAGKAGKAAGGGGGGGGGAGGGEDDAGETLEDVIAASRAGDNPFEERLVYYLPVVWRPQVTAEDLIELHDEDALRALPEVVDDLPRGAVTYGFQEAAITMVGRPVVSEDFFMDFSRGYDIGTLPPLVRLVLLDFVIGCSDPDVAECVLSEADLVALTTIRRQQRFHSLQANCMDNYVRQDVFSAWKAGFQKHQETMAANYSTGEVGNEPWKIVKMLQEKSEFYAQQAIQFHCSNITDGVYRSEILTHLYEVYKQLKDVLKPRLLANLEKWGASERPTEWMQLDSTSQMRLLFFRGLREFNQKAHMSYTNLAIVTELFTTMIQWFIHPGNETWSCWLIPLQVPRPPRPPPFSLLPWPFPLFLALPPGKRTVHLEGHVLLECSVAPAQTGGHSPAPCVPHARGGWCPGGGVWPGCHRSSGGGGGEARRCRLAVRGRCAMRRGPCGHCGSCVVEAGGECTEA